MLLDWSRRRLERMTTNVPSLDHISLESPLCPLQTSAKTLKFAVPASSPATPKSAPSTPMPASSSSSSRDGAPSTSTLPLAQANDPTVAGISVVPPKQKMSLQSMAKREHARKMLMSGFVRGKPEPVKKEEPIAKETLKAPVEQAITSSSLQPSQPGPSTEVLAESSTSSSSSKVKGKDKESSKTKKRKSSSSKTNETTSSNKSDKKKRRRDGKPDASSSKVDSKKAKRSDKVEAGADGETLIESKEARALRKALRAEEKLSKKRKRKDETESGQTSTTLSSRASMPTHDESSESPSSKEQRRAEKLEKKGTPALPRKLVGMIWLEWQNSSSMKFAAKVD
jgi:hypothetical protein